MDLVRFEKKTVKRGPGALNLLPEKWQNGKIQACPKQSTVLDDPGVVGWTPAVDALFLWHQGGAPAKRYGHGACMARGTQTFERFMI